MEEENYIDIDITPSSVQFDLKASNQTIDLTAAPSSSVDLTVATYSKNYDSLSGKPKINGVILQGDKSSQELNIVEDKTYIHRQKEVSKEWTIIHNLNKYPSVTIINSAGDEVIGDVRYYKDNINKVTVYFQAEFKGTAILN